MPGEDRRLVECACWLYYGRDDPLITLDDARDDELLADAEGWVAGESVCPVCRLRPATLDEVVGIFQPCRTCQQAGWQVRWKKPKGTRP